MNATRQKLFDAWKKSREIEKETKKQELLKTLRKLTVSANATLACVIHIHNYVNAYDSYNLDTAFDFIRSQLEQSKYHIRAIEKVIDDENSKR